LQEEYYKAGTNPGKTGQKGRAELTEKIGESEPAKRPERD
jgi:hypothetical protein